MFTKTVAFTALMLAVAGATAVPAAAQTVSPTPFIQCVENNAGIAATVRWYNASSVEYLPPAAVDDPRTPFFNETQGRFRLPANATPARDETVLVGDDSCITGADGQRRRVAVVSGWGVFNNGSIEVSGRTLEELACDSATGRGCRVGNYRFLASEMGLPDPNSTFYIGIAGMVEFSGNSLAPNMSVSREHSPAEADYEAVVDFCAKGRKDTHTADTIAFEFLSAQTVVDRQSIKGSVSDCHLLSKGYLSAEITTSRIITAVRVSTSGGDAMLIDQVKVYRDGDLEFQDGRDDFGGWCLSKDPLDYQGGWEKSAESCAPTYTFSMPAN